ncbi:MAG: SUMF1/EgtB/PvdO family nonheme iron enzyme [Saprospiraceae bacterium]
MKHTHSLCFLLALILLAASASPTKPPRHNKDFALFIAVEDYQLWGKLKHPIGEVEKIAAELHRDYGFDTLILRNPTQEQILATLRRYAQRKYTDDGQLLLYLSGHGDFDELTKEGFFIPLGGRRDDATQTSYLPFSRLQRIVENIPCRHILLAIDACYSGTFDRLVAMKGDKELTFGRPAPPGSERDRFIERELTLQSRYFVASGKKEQTPDASNFAAYFLRALRTGGRDHSVLTMHELVAELKKALPKPHVATFSGHQDEANFLFIKNATAPPLPPENLYDARRDRADWQEAERLDSAAAYRAYLSKQPRGEFRALAETRAGQREAEELEINAWNTAKQANTCEAYRTFLRDYPLSTYRVLAEDFEKQRCVPAAPEHMVRVPGGQFEMGDVLGDKEQADEQVHTVTVGSFYLGKTEVTFDEYEAFCTATDRDKPSDSNWGRGKRPAINVSWLDAVAYCNWLSERQNLKKVYTISGETVTADWSAEGYRLPTEAEWEYAARGGGKRVRFGNGKDVADPAEINFDGSASYKTAYSRTGEYRQKTMPAGSFSPNGLGLHDMSGNVWEWCWDWYGTYPTRSETNPIGPSSGGFRVLRGGSWSRDPAVVRAAGRDSNGPSFRVGSMGFRLARAARGG